MSFRSILAAVALMLAPLAASAVTIPPNGSNNGGVGIVASGEFLENLATWTSPVTFEFVADETLRVGGQATALQASGFTGFSLSYGRTGSLSVLTPEFSGTNISYVLPSIDLAAGESITVSFNFASIAEGSGGQFSVSTTAVPLPAAAWMLITALGGMGLLARRRSTA